MIAIRAIKLVCVAFCVLHMISKCQVQAQSRIVGGTTTTIAEYNFMVQIYVSNSFTCGGSLVKPKFVVTAAHCTDGNTYTQYRIKAGATNLSSSGTTQTVVRVVRPSGYNSNTMDQDLAILQLKGALSGTNIGTIPLFTGSVPSGATVITAGWGATSESGGVSNTLQKVELAFVTRSTCRSQIGSSQITNNMICAKKANKDSCYGDSGGPLIYNNRLAGVVSWGYGCARTSPGVYTDIAAMASLINKVIAKYE